MSTVTSDPGARLPRGPHGLTRADVAASQRARLIAAFTEQLAEHGYAKVTIGGLARRAGVSRGAFYEQFADKKACLFAAYESFAAGLAEAMTTELADDIPWNSFIEAVLAGYLDALERDPVAARAFILEMDSAGEAARRRRRDEVHAIAGLLAERHTAIRARDPKLGALPVRAWLGLALGVRELVREALEAEGTPDLTRLAPEILVWVAAMVEGAAAANRDYPQARQPHEA